MDIHSNCVEATMYKNNNIQSFIELIHVIQTYLCTQTVWKLLCKHKYKVLYRNHVCYSEPFVVRIEILRNIMDDEYIPDDGVGVVGDVIVGTCKPRSIFGALGVWLQEKWTGTPYKGQTMVVILTAVAIWYYCPCIRRKFKSLKRMLAGKHHISFSKCELVCYQLFKFDPFYVNNTAYNFVSVFQIISCNQICNFHKHYLCVWVGGGGLILFEQGFEYCIANNLPCVTSIALTHYDYVIQINFKDWKISTMIPDLNNHNTMQYKVSRV